MVTVGTYLDPGDADVRTRTLALGELNARASTGVMTSVLRLQHRDAPTDQVMGRNVWKSRVIESILMRVPVGSFWVVETDTTWLLVDGNGRMSAVNMFMLGRFSLTGVEFMSEIDGLTFDELRGGYKTRITEAGVTVNIIKARTPALVTATLLSRVLPHAITPPSMLEVITDVLNGYGK